MSSEGAEAKEGGFSSRWGLVLTAMGAAVGTGNIWRFPREAATHGGGAFMIPWLIFLFAWSIPLLMAEFALGKHTRLGTIGTFRDFAGKKYTWMGVWMVWVSAAVGFYYAVVMGWTIHYFWVAFSGDITTYESAAITEQRWDDFINSPLQVIFFQFIAVAISGFIVHRGIQKGIEKTNKILMPTLIVLLIFAAIYPFTQNAEGAFRGLKYLFLPDPDYMFKADTWLAALTQSAWSTSAGFGMAITYAVYMRKKEDVSLNAFLTGLGNNAISLIAGVAVIGTVFAMSTSTAQGLEAVHAGSSGLTFIHLTALFATAPGGRFIAAMFFLAMSFAALTSMIATMEIAARNLIDMGYERPQALKWISVAIFALGIPSAISLQFLDSQDFVWGTGLIVSGLFTSFAVIKYGSRKRAEGGTFARIMAALRYGPYHFRKEFINTEDSDLWIGRWWDYAIYLMVFVEFPIIFLWGLYNTTLQNIVLMIIQWSIVLAVFIYKNDYFASLIKRGEYTPDDTEVEGGDEIDEEDYGVDAEIDAG